MDHAESQGSEWPHWSLSGAMALTLGEDQKAVCDMTGQQVVDVVVLMLLTGKIYFFKSSVFCGPLVVFEIAWR